jgi:tRNA(Ile)-lysidine synthase TilS/MesJ
MAGSSRNPTSSTGTKLWLVESTLTDVVVTAHNLSDYIVRAATEEDARRLFMEDYPDDNIILCRPLTLDDISRVMKEDVVELFL